MFRSAGNIAHVLHPQPQASLPQAHVEVLAPAPWLLVGPARRVEWTRVTLSAPVAPAAGLRLVQLSDLHLRHHPHPALEMVTERLRQDPPDVLLITGDFVDDKFDYGPAFPALEQVLTNLRQIKRPILGILGNHDGDLLAGRLEGLGVTLVDDRSVRLRRGGEVLLDVLGLPGVHRLDPHGWFDRDRDPDVPTVVLSHYPDAVLRLDRLRPDVVFAGHTHGGQICLPGGHALLTHDSLPHRMSRGVHATAHGWLVVSRGIGTTRLHARVFAPPQVVEVILKPFA